VNFWKGCYNAVLYLEEGVFNEMRESKEFSEFHSYKVEQQKYFNEEKGYWNWVFTYTHNSRENKCAAPQDEVEKELPYELLILNIHVNKHDPQRGKSKNIKEIDQLKAKFETMLRNGSVKQYLEKIKKVERKEKNMWVEFSIAKHTQLFE